MSDLDHLLSGMAEEEEQPLSMGGDLCVRVDDTDDKQPDASFDYASAPLLSDGLLLSSIVGDQFTSLLPDDPSSMAMDDSDVMMEHLQQHLPLMPHVEHIMHELIAPDSSAAMTSTSMMHDVPTAAATASSEDAVKPSEKRKSTKRHEEPETIDPTFPVDIIMEQEDFIFSTVVVKPEEAERPLTKWDAYSTRVYKLSRTLARKSKTVLRKTDEQEELFRYQIYTIKKTIKGILQQVALENAQDMRFPSLESGSGEEDLIDVEAVVCSRCGGSDTPDNDILLCDKAGCCRAYHQRCLDPEVDPETVKDSPYWFCWTCDTLNTCFNWINSKTGSSFNKVEDVFPELPSQAAMWESTFAPGFYDPEQPVLPYVPLHNKKRKAHTVVGGETYSSEEDDVALEIAETNPKSRKRRTEPGKPKIYNSGYVVFTKEVLGNIRIQFPLFSHPELMRKLGDMWSQLTGEEKEVYNLKGRENKAAYRIQMKEYHDLHGPLSSASQSLPAQPSSPDASTTGLRLVCSVCGKGFKTDGGYKYHVANVCIIDMEDANPAPRWPRAHRSDDPGQEERVTLE